MRFHQGNRRKFILASCCCPLNILVLDSSFKWLLRGTTGGSAGRFTSLGWMLQFERQCSVANTTAQQYLSQADTTHSGHDSQTHRSHRSHSLTAYTSDTYDPFGNTTASRSTGANAIAYTCGEFDAAGLYFYRTRYYNPAFGRFISEDPILPGSGSNASTYTFDNPLLMYDRFGLCPPRPRQFSRSFILGKGRAAASSAACWRSFCLPR
jgi:RHS repeat-associated protein